VRGSRTDVGGNPGDGTAIAGKAPVDDHVVAIRHDHAGIMILMPEWRSPDVPVHALYEPSRYMAPRVRALLDFLLERFSTVSRDLEVYLNPVTEAS